MKTAHSARPDHLRVFVLGALLSILLISLILTVRMLNDPVQNTTLDFMIFYAAGRIAQTHGLPSLYNLDLQRRVFEDVLGFRLAEQHYLIYNHVPILGPLLALLVNESYTASFLRWMLVLAAIALTSLQILTGLLPPVAKPWRLYFAGSLIFYPLYISIAQGQDTAFILLGIAVFLWGLQNGRETLGGLGLSLVTLRPQFALFVLVPLFFWSRRAWRAYLLGSLLLAAASFLMIGRQGALDFIQVLQISSAGGWLGFDKSTMFNLLGLVLRIFPAFDPALARQAAWAFYGLAALGAVLISALLRPERETKIGLVVLLYLLASPHLHYHDLSLMLVPAVILAARLCRENPALIRRVTAFCAAASLFSVMTGEFSPTFYSLPYILLAALFIALSFPGSFIPPDLRQIPN